MNKFIFEDIYLFLAFAATDLFVCLIIPQNLWIPCFAVLGMFWTGFVLAVDYFIKSPTSSILKILGL